MFWTCWAEERPVRAAVHHTTRKVRKHIKRAVKAKVATTTVVVCVALGGTGLSIKNLQDQSANLSRGKLQETSAPNSEYPKLRTSISQKPTPVPEPSTFLLLGSALAAGLFFKHRAR